LAQIEADARTHSDVRAQKRIIKAVRRLRDIAQGNVSAGLVEQNELALV
jgi:phage gp36-like protein